MSEKSQARKEARQKRRTKLCHCCGKTVMFCWRYRNCGFSICQNCMYENEWGMTCNGITWQCLDCGDQNGFGNQ
ncbi:MAG: hypothetical protein R6V54_13995 [Desulfobacteraceae bacterium]